MAGERAVEEHHSLAGQVSDGRPVRSGQPVPAGHHQAEGFGHQHSVRQILWRCDYPVESDVDTSVAEATVLFVVGQLRDGRLHPGVASTKGGQSAHQHHR